MIVGELLKQYDIEGAPQAFQDALQALDALQTGATTPSAAQGACRPMVTVFDAVLGLVTWRRVQDAQTVAELELQRLHAAQDRALDALATVGATSC